MTKITIFLSKFECLPGLPEISVRENPAPFGASAVRAAERRAVMEFHIRREVRERCGLEHSLFSLTGNVVLADVRQARALTAKLNAGVDPAKNPERIVKAGQLNAMGLIDEILHYIVALYREQVVPALFEQAAERLEDRLGEGRIDVMLRQFGNLFPPQAVYAGETSVEAYLSSSAGNGGDGGENRKSLTLEELLLLGIANLNPAFSPFLFMFDDKDLARRTVYPAAIEELKTFFAALPVFGPDGQNLWDLLRAPALASPDSLAGQLDFMRKRWGLILNKFMGRLLTSLDIIKEEEKPSFFGPGPMEAYTYAYLENEYEHFSPDQDWMPRTVLMAKSTLVWLFQLSKKYGRDISRLDQIPDEELDELARRGFTGLWLIGLWERSSASRTIKQWTGNPEAAASAYSLYDYDIAGELGGWGALANLRERAMRRGIRLGSDMVPNHTGIDSRWMIEHPDRFLQLPYSPFPGYTFNCGNLSGRDDITVQIEEHYFTRTDAAVVFRRIDNHSGETRYIYHGNDGTSMPWNDTAQIDFLNPEAREAVIRTIVGVCKQFPIVRFDAAMTLAKRHIQRLWYPEPGRGGDIASRAEHAIGAEEFNRRIPNEFWREVVDRCAAEAPGTLLLAEAFWMMEGYFVRTLGMHRVYNSAFMNMLKMEDNAKYRATIKNTLEFDPEILKRFVNFMNNPDEETAVAQFGRGDKYFGVCTLLVTMPGLPMFGHGQIDGFEEKYGMEYRRSYRDEQSDERLVERHEREIFPLMKKRYLFSGSADFRLYDFFSGGTVNENVFAYSNRAGAECALVLYNNSYSRASGWIKNAAGGGAVRDSLCFALGLHGENDRFVLMRELRSSLWYIRSSKDIAEHGLFASLDGYQAQVFLDIHEIQDNGRGEWARLNHELSGRGAPDLEAAKMDIVLGELYYRFGEIFKPGIEPDALKPLFTGFIETARKFIDGNGLYDPWIKTPEPEQEAASSMPRAARTTQSARTARPAGDRPKAMNRKSPEKIWDDFTVYLERMIPVHAAFEDGGSPLAESKCAGFAYAYISLALLRPVIGDAASGNDAVSLALHWQLDRKLREILCRLGADEESARYFVETAKAVLSRGGDPEKSGGKTARVPSSKPAKTAAKPDAKDLARQLILDNYADDDFRRILGINVFDDVTWYNKEAFERALHYGSICAAMECGDPALVKKTAGELKKAEKRSGYRLDALIEALCPGADRGNAAGPLSQNAGPSG
ncbi:MAG: alpha-amylase [Treponema sp.]|jgi:glycosidase|nr:alpha-amylase [Treponema sp.]